MDPIDNQSSGRVACDAETLRRAGNPGEARKIADEALRDDETPALRVAHGLALLDLGEARAARDELERAFALLEGFTGESAAEAEAEAEPEASVFHPAVPQGQSLDAIADSELEDAFLEAESRPDEMWSANRLAEAALSQIEEGVPEGVPLAPDSPFATATVAGLLEEQGHSDEAQALREAIATDGGSAWSGDRARVMATLERWLHELRSAS